MATTLVGTAKTCKHKAHARYSAALEGLYIQTWMALRDLGDVMDTAALRSSEKGPVAAGTFIHLNDHKVREAEERLAFGRSELEAAQVIVDRHLTSGRCPHNA